MDPILRLAGNSYQNVVEQGQRAWPAFHVDAFGFVAHLARLEVTSTAASKFGDDLYLAYACACGDPPALKVFESILVNRAGEWLARFRLSADQQEEICQVLREKLFTGSPAKIRTYCGNGPLEAWTRMVMIRVAMDLTSVQPRWRSLEKGLAETLVGREDSPEIETFRRRYLPALESAFRDILVSLSARERSLMRFYFVDDLTIDQLATVYKVHRATVARWLASLRKQLLDQVSASVGLTTGLGHSEVVSLWNLLRSDIKVSVSRILKSAAPP